MAQASRPMVTLKPKTRTGSCPDTLRASWESVWSASKPAKNVMVSRYVKAGGGYDAH